MSCFHRRTLEEESHEPISIIIPKTEDHAQNNIFQWGPPIFQKNHQGKRFFMTGVENFFLNCLGDIL